MDIISLIIEGVLGGIVDLVVEFLLGLISGFLPAA